MSALPPSSSSLMLKRKRQFKYDIFLSLKGKDTRKEFTSHLYSALTRQGIETFKDDKSLKKGKDFAPELLRAIGESWGSIIVISKTYAFSHWCLDELVEIMKQREERGLRVYPIFYKVEPSDFRNQIKTVKEAFDKHEKRYDREKTQWWRVALEKVTNINGWVLKDQCESDFIDDIVKNISEEFDVEVLDEEEVEKLKSTFQTIQAWLVDAENEQLIKQGKSVKVWLDRLKHIAYDIDDVLDKWNIAIRISNFEKDQAQTPSVSSPSLNRVRLSFKGRGASSLGLPNLHASELDILSTSFHFDGIALKIKELNKKSQDIVKKKDDFPFTLGSNSSCTDLRLERPKTVSLIDESVVYGRDYEINALIRLLLSDDNDERGTGSGIPLLAILGMGGLGKTTLAQLAYNDEKVKKLFQQRIWVCVSDPFDVVGIAKAILESLNGAPSSFKELGSLLQEIHKKIDREKFLLVLDDVWNEDYGKWEPLKLSLCSGSQESRILVTTRKKNVASIMGCPKPLLLGKLSNEDSWSLFGKIAFVERSYQDRENLESIARKCVEKCKGLPLAVKTLAGLLRFKKSREQWQRILDSPMWQLDKVKEELISPLLLSYYDLLPPIRQCFSYCAIFPKDHKIEKDVLIKLWMAQGFLGDGNEMEIVGEENFDDLAKRSFFQEFEKDEVDDSIIISCKMHDIVHDFAQFLRKDECCVVASNGIHGEQRADSYHENVRHLTLIRGNYNVGIPDSTYTVKKLRSLLVDSGRYYGTSSILEASLPKLFDQLVCLRMLNLSCSSCFDNSSIKEVPQEIGKLMHLRYLNFEGNSALSELPDTLCDLCNLQTLNIRGCSKLGRLPYGMEKLINLRHLENKGTNRLIMPKGLQRLTSLHTLEELYVEKKGIESETSFSLSDLGNLIHLRGNLHIEGLANVGEAEAAREARVSAKAGLRSLCLYFDGGDHDGTMIEDEASVLEASVLEALHPPQHLQILEIWHFKGPESPNWMTSLTWLKSVELRWCDYWESLPPMGKLPSLESLYIEGMNEVEKVGEEFVGVETSSSSSSFVNHNNYIAFPNLKSLTFHDMPEWVEWEYEDEIFRSRACPNITIMPKLQHLSLSHCSKLKTLPYHLLQSTTLEQLEVYYCYNLYRRFNKETGGDWSSISHIPTLQIW